MGDPLWLLRSARALPWILLALLLSRHCEAQAEQQLLGSPLPTNDTSLWVCRPNLYFGVRPRIPRSLLTGLIWGNMDSYATVQSSFRHTCEQNEGMEGYGWDEYDAQNGGRQTIHDTGNKLDLTIDFVKVPGPSGGSWAARIKGTPREDAPANIVTTVIFYAAMEGLGQLGFEDDLDQKGTVSLGGESSELGAFTIDVTPGPDNTLPYKTHKSWDNRPLDQTLVTSQVVPPEVVWAGKNVMLADMKDYVEGLAEEHGQEDMPPPWQAFTISNEPKPANFHMVQKVLVGAFEFDILYSSASGARLTSAKVDEVIPETSKSFKAKFDKVFKPLAPFDSKEYVPFAESLFSNLIGGVGYFYGDSLVDRSYASEYDEDNEGFWDETADARARAEAVHDPPTELLTSVPSRPFFPRGFLWDEGFHLVPIVEWDLELTLEIVQSWFKLMDSEGWIAREQILGPEARSKVPPEFQVQYPHYANPPTLFMIIERLAEKANSKVVSTADSAKIKSYLETIYPLLKRQYYWFRKTQFGELNAYDREASNRREAYRWRGRTPRHILTSGLDDYPRAQPPHPGELHIDLISWVGMMQKGLISVARLLGESEDATTVEKHYAGLVANIDDLHWSSKDKCYCDATIDDYEESVHVCHKGYISLFPFMTGLLPASHPNMPEMLKLIRSEAELWSPHGIRSLSQIDELYGTEENYWRSPVWMNMNYLILKNLLATATSSEASAPKALKEQARKIYTELRKNLVDTVYNEWKATGFAWEQYNPDTGKGQRTQHFTGWTSLVTVMMRMPDLSKGSGHTEL